MDTDGRILYRTTRYSTLPASQLMRLDPKSGVREAVPLAQGSEGTYEPKGQTLYFTRFPGRAAAPNDMRVAGSKTSGATPPASRKPNPSRGLQGTSRNPMWWEGRLYFSATGTGR